MYHSHSADEPYRHGRTPFIQKSAVKFLFSCSMNHEGLGRYPVCVRMSTFVLSSGTVSKQQTGNDKMRTLQILSSYPHFQRTVFKKQKT